MRAQSPETTTAALGAADRRQAAATVLLQGLPSAQLAGLLRGAQLLRLPRGAMLFEEGDLPDHVYMLVRGELEAFAREDGRDCTILIFAKSDVFLTAAAISGEPFLMAVRSLRPSRVIAIPASRIRAEMASCPVFAGRVAMLLAGQSRMLVRHIRLLKTRTGPQRLASFLLRLVDERGTAGSADLPAKKGVLASRLGIAPETLSRSLQLLKSEGLAVRGHRVIVEDRERAEAFCRRNPLSDGSEEQLDIGFW